MLLKVLGIYWVLKYFYVNSWKVLKVIWSVEIITEVYVNFWFFGRYLKFCYLNESEDLINVIR